MIQERSISQSENGSVDEYQNLYDFAKAQEMDVKDTQAWLELFKEFYKAREYIAAQECLDQAIRLGHGLEELYTLKAIVYYKQGRYHYAIHYLDKVTDIDPDEIHSWFLKGDAYYRIGQYGQAVKCLDKAHALNPGDEESLRLRDSALTLSRIYPDQAPRYTRKRMEKDVQEIVNAITTGTEHPAVYYRNDKAVLNPRKIPNLIDAHSQTVGERSRRLKDRVRQVMATQTGYVETHYRSMLAYQTSKVSTK